MTRNLTRTLVAAALGAFVIGAGAAAPVTDLPAVQKSGGTEYMIGGGGEGQAHAMEKAGKDWPLMVTFAQNDGKRAEFVVDVKAVIRDAKGQEVLKLDKAGPILLADISPGEYSVGATLGGKTLERKVQVKKNASARIEMLWPTGTAH